MTRHGMIFGTRPARGAFSQFVVVLVAGLLIACGDSASTGPDAGPGPVPVSRVAIAPTQGALLIGRTVQLQAYAIAASGDTLRNRTVTWRSNAPSIATVTADGLVTAIASGSAFIVAGAGGVEGVTAITVAQREVASVEIDLVQVDLEEGLARQATAVARDADGGRLTDRVVTWHSADPSIAAVNAQGTITALRWGTTTVTASVDGKSASGTVRVIARSAYDLLFDSRTSSTNASQLYRLDFRAPGAAPTLIMPFSGTWDVSASPDGSKIAFVGTGMQPQIFVANRDGTGILQLTTGPSGADQPAWSPDGSRIAFRRWASGGPPGIFNTADIWTMNADGTGATNLTPASDGTTAESPTWSPRQPDGGYRIAYSEQRMSGGYLVGNIVSIRADGSDKRTVTAGGMYLESHPAWSPDGSAIVFIRTGGTAFGDLWIVNMLTGADRQLIANDPEGEQRTPSWSPDGSLIAFTSNHEPTIDNRYSYQLYTVTATGTGLVRRTPQGTEKENPAWILRQ